MFDNEHLQTNISIIIN